ncbi:MAG: TA system VapC family ribonuclease toxin [Scytonema sp. PMC 1069.18]|nr:TA system VapC family ribonuclease toxin [Scytonema sp. PMC 1069.18]MEC4885977.1 TA system VapC family ribonuclease toxin [Scytonema sp. PMC 1070.18]
MSIYLLDVNVLLALSDPMHIYHEAAHRWFATKGKYAWATCPITENGFVRIASHPNYPNRPGDVPSVLAILRQFCTMVGHHFWSEDVSIRELLQPNVLIPHSQITDVFLLGLAVQKEGKLATFDQRIVTSAVQGGSKALELIAP